MLLTGWCVFRTQTGLRLRSVGENPLAAETAGLSPVRIRYRAVAISGALAAAGGAYLSIGFVGSFTENMTAGQGFIGLAVMICGRWMPQGALVFALLFGFFTALAPAAAGVLTLGRDAVPGAAVRDHADRRRRPRRPLDPARGRRPPARPLIVCTRFPSRAIIGICAAWFGSFRCSLSASSAAAA